MDNRTRKKLGGMNHPRPVELSYDSMVKFNTFDRFRRIERLIYYYYGFNRLIYYCIVLGKYDRVEVYSKTRRQIRNKLADLGVVCFSPEI